MNALNIYFLIHAGFEKAGYFETWAREHEHSVNFTHCYQNEALPPLDYVDVLIVMGGPQSPGETDKYPYLADEITFIREAIRSNKKVIGVCLGAQMIAECYGAKTEKSPNKEVGFFPLKLTEAAKADPIFASFPATLMSGHWHNDMPGLPAQAEVLAYSEGCPRQIIRFSKHVYGFQCHFELDIVTIKGLVRYCPQDLVPGKYIQSAEDLLAFDLSEINQYLSQFLDQFLQ